MCFYLGVAMVFTHELDAMSNHEWRVLPFLKSMPDDAGMTVFVLAHIPIFATVLALVASLNIRTRTVARMIISAFLLFHGLLHALHVNHSKYEFSGLLSNTLIFGGAILGALYIVATIVQKDGKVT